MLLSTQALMAVALTQSPLYVQSVCDGAPGAKTSAWATLPSSVQLGSLLVVSAQFEGASDSMTITDTLGTRFVPVAPLFTYNGNGAQMWYGVSTSSGNDDVTMTLSDGGMWLHILASEYLDAGPLTASIDIAGSTSNPTTDLYALPAGALVVAQILGAPSAVSSPLFLREACDPALADGVIPASGMSAFSFTVTDSPPWIFNAAVFGGPAVDGGVIRLGGNSADGGPGSSSNDGSDGGWLVSYRVGCGCGAAPELWVLGALLAVSRFRQRLARR